MRVDQASFQDDDTVSLVAIAHELKTPLALIRQLSLAKPYYTAEELDNALTRIELIASKSLRLVETITRSHGVASFETETINLNRICEEVVHEFTPLSKAMDQSIELTLPKKPVLAIANQEIVRSILFGLCDNALHNSDESVRLSVRHHEHSTRISVKDSGPQLSSSQYKKLKERIGKMPQPVPGRPGGSGLGLYVAHQFAKVMEGKIGVHARQKDGHTFFVELPKSLQLNLFGV